MSAPPPVVSVATRASALARWQADLVAAQVVAVATTRGREVGTDTVIVSTHGDRRDDVALRELGGKGVFVKEVQAAVLDGRARIAVHSAKDLPAVTPAGLVLAAVPERADPRDVLVGATLDRLAPGAPIATGSLRRRVQLADRRPDLTFGELRGNIATRLDRVPTGGAIVMAAAALDRLGLFPDLVRRGLAYEVLDPAVMIPQVAQGALAVECRADDDEMVDLLAAIEHPSSRRMVDAERAFLAQLGGDCRLPAAAHATPPRSTPPRSGDAFFGIGQKTVTDTWGVGEVEMTGMLASVDGHVVLRHRMEGSDPERLGRDLASHLLDRFGGTTTASW